MFHKRLFAIFTKTCSFGSFPVLPFLDCSVFTKENSKFTKDFPPLPNPLKPGKNRENSQITKEIPCLKFTKEIQTIKERKDRVLALQSRQNRPNLQNPDKPPKTMKMMSTTPSKSVLSGTGDSQHDSRESIRANHSQLRPLFL